MVCLIQTVFNFSVSNHSKVRVEMFKEQHKNKIIINTICILLIKHSYFSPVRL